MSRIKIHNIPPLSDLDRSDLLFSLNAGIERADRLQFVCHFAGKDELKARYTERIDNLKRLFRLIGKS
jgi:hypothetical protein